MDKVKIWCNNLDCPHNQKVNEPTHFSFNKFRDTYTSGDLNEVLGKCSKIGYDFLSIEVESTKIKYSVALCYQEGNALICDRTDCLHNVDKLCDRGKIWVNKLTVDNEIYWECKCFSLKKFTGHRDWSQLLNPDKTAKGGNISDEDAKKYYEDSLKFKSFGTHHRDSKEPKKTQK